ncbi:MerR-like DNA binding protein [Neolewinella xylanilytica]|uniref:MerR-like DNA binding protein n=1 Tax=Neolewinella xylanilytica TaxID=1514080 RepID=A0A2S6I3A7_9BACT|nr:chaperone modulator CbpM [Neolewinella xylanilytica]PPK85643.1 MerR-like DNA binding protein [Neolewinella xylanilytica]
MNSGVAYITIEQFCTFHQCETVVIKEFLDHGIFEVQTPTEVILIPETQVPRIERALRLHNELGVNAAGIDIILRLLDRIEYARRGEVEDWDDYE